MVSWPLPSPSSAHTLLVQALGVPCHCTASPGWQGPLLPYFFFGLHHLCYRDVMGGGWPGKSPGLWGALIGLLLSSWPHGPPITGLGPVGGGCSCTCHILLCPHWRGCQLGAEDI